jgi:hypothetical protein
MASAKNASDSPSDPWLAKLLDHESAFGRKLQNLIDNAQIVEEDYVALAGSDEKVKPFGKKLRVLVNSVAFCYR